MEFIPAKTIVSGYKENPHWFGINYGMNIYKGCCHGCIYCDSRSNCYQIIEFDRVRIKENSTEIIKKELKSKKTKGVVGTGAMSDPYNPFEEKFMLTREALKVVDENRFGISIATKSDLITRDIDILKRIQSHSPTIIKITITTYDDNLCKKIESNVCPTSKRFKALKKLSDNGIYAGVLLMPILPFINDNEDNIKNIIKKAYQSGAKFVFTYGLGVTLRQNQREYYFEQLRKIFPYENLDKKYIKVYGESYENGAANYDKLWKTFKEECEKYNLLYDMKDIIADYKNKYEKTQISWF
ncbi:radical SAM protein [Paraclostridium benzoelyticum]|uniref:Radical SAM protein n=1 Tax=Paraclostridium benzoelyticum TaxID=1629550 RepID=A0A0M3DK66_9FIRM|nr:radical SAM protein [Paraclostridium benzoelyticum]KKY02541.1 radical SAM protein [Paraclostridium benzoelyticum]MDM8128867.1 radical SAM protein [Paraclostridium benzoelyticum]OXX84514.1 radical SAM protein [Paraclostridium benzoelyticum]